MDSSSKNIKQTVEFADIWDSTTLMWRNPNVVRSVDFFRTETFQNVFNMILIKTGMLLQWN